MRRLLFQGWHRTKTLSRAQKLRAWAYRLEGVAQALLWIVCIGLLVVISSSQRALRESRQAGEERKTVESAEVSKARLDLPAPLKEEWARQKARVRSLEAERQRFEMGLMLANVVAAWCMLCAMLLAKWFHDRADYAETLEPEAEEGRADLLRPVSHLNEPGSE
jgi:hypothetical protein